VHCTGLLGLDAFAEFDLPRRLVLSEAGAATFWGAAGQSVIVRSDRIRAAVIDRAALDAYLVQRAVEAGASLRLNTRAESVAIGAQGVTVRGARVPEGLRARACVLACGANYRFHRALGLGLPQVFLQSAQVETPFPAAPAVEVRFGRDVAPAGFAWHVPFTRDHVSYARIGLMGETRARERFDTFLASLCARLSVPVSTIPTPRLKMLPLGPVDRTFGNRVLAVGDAAGLVKPTTGGGIYYGMLSGALAADVLGSALRDDRLDAVRLRRYEQGWRRTLGREIRVGLAFRKIATRLSDRSIDALIDLSRTTSLVPLMQEQASFNWHSRAAIALLGHPSFRRIVLKGWTGSGERI
jgi:flavin-dependent dehydrogenase